MQKDSTAAAAAAGAGSTVKAVGQDAAPDCDPTDCGADLNRTAATTTGEVAVPSEEASTPAPPWSETAKSP